jgi:hypothetical protein
VWRGRAFICERSGDQKRTERVSNTWPESRLLRHTAPQETWCSRKWLCSTGECADRFERKLEPVPEGAQIIRDGKAANVAVLFARSQRELARDFGRLAKSLPEKVALWIAWPKKASGVATDLTENVVREFGLDSGWVDYKVCAIDETWSGLCFARKC